MDNWKETAAFLIGVALIICSLSVPIALYYADKNAKIESAVKSGSAPLGVMCAFGNAQRETCRDYVQRSK